MWSSIIKKAIDMLSDMLVLFYKHTSSGALKLIRNVKGVRAPVPHTGSGWDSGICLLLHVCNILQFLVSISALHLYTIMPSLGSQYAYFRLTLSSTGHYSWQWFRAIVWELWKWRFQSACRFPERHHFPPLSPSWCTPTAHQPAVRQAQRKLQIQRGRLCTCFRRPVTCLQIPLVELLIMLPLCGAGRLKSSVFSRVTPPLPSQASRVLCSRCSRTHNQMHREELFHCCACSSSKRTCVLCRSRVRDVWGSIIYTFSSSIRLKQPSRGHSFTLWNITFSPALCFHGIHYKKIFFWLPAFETPPPPTPALVPALHHKNSPYWFLFLIH